MLKNEIGKSNVTKSKAKSKSKMSPSPIAKANENESKFKTNHMSAKPQQIE